MLHTNDMIAAGILHIPIGEHRVEQKKVHEHTHTHMQSKNCTISRQYQFARSINRDIHDFLRLVVGVVVAVPMLLLDVVYLYSMLPLLFCSSHLPKRA